MLQLNSHLHRLAGYVPASTYKQKREEEGDHSLDWNQIAASDIFIMPILWLRCTLWSWRAYLKGKFCEMQLPEQNMASSPSRGSSPNFQASHYEMSQLRGYDTPTAPPTTPAARGPAEDKIRWDLFICIILSLALGLYMVSIAIFLKSCHTCSLAFLDHGTIAAQRASKIWSAVDLVCFLWWACHETTSLKSVQKRTELIISRCSALIHAYMKWGSALDPMGNGRRGAFSFFNNILNCGIKAKWPYRYHEYIIARFEACHTDTHGSIILRQMSIHLAFQ